MQEQIKAWAARFGLRTDQVEAGLGSLLGFIQSKVPAAQWEQVRSKLPQADELIQRAKLAPAAAQGAAQGLLGQAMEMMGKVSGSAQWSVSQLFAQLQQAGFRPDNAVAFASEVMGQVKSAIGTEKFDNLLQVAPGLRDAVANLAKLIKKP